MVAQRNLHLSADAITKRLSDMTDAELAALEARMIATTPIVLAIFDAPRTFPESNVGHATIRLTCCRKSGTFCEVP